MGALVVARAVNKTFSLPRGKGGVHKCIQVLSDVDITVNAGEVVSIVGPSGSGKSTLLYCLSGLEPVDSGSVEIAGCQIAGAKARLLSKIRREHVGFVFQSYNLVPSLSAADNISLPARLAGWPLASDQVEAIMGKVGLGGRGKARVTSMSGGEQQRVAIARVLASKAEVVFADEPTGALDTSNAREAGRLLRGIANDTDRSVVMVTHDLEAASSADRVIVLRDGRVVCKLERATAKQILEAMEASS